MTNTPYSDFYKKKMDSAFVKKEPEKNAAHEEKITEEKEHIKPLIVQKQAPKTGNKLLNIIFYIAVIIAIGLITWLIISNRAKSIYIFIAIILLFFIVFYFFHKEYEKAVHNANKRAVLSVVYLLLTADMILGMRVYSVEWAFLGFLACAVICYDAKIDSRFLILPALFLLGYIPFLLIAKYQALAESIAVYVYYFLVIGVGLQFIEYLKKREGLLDFEEVMKEVIASSNWIITACLLGIAEVLIIIFNRFYNLEAWKYTVLYFFIISVIFYAIKNQYYKSN